MAEIGLTLGKHALVDDADLKRLQGKRWHAVERHGNRFYAEHSFGVDGSVRSVLMHRYLMDARPGQVVDHINGDGLDNRRSNLRVATNAQNSANRKAHGQSRFVGVAPSRKLWRASIAPGGVAIFLGAWATEELAAAAYNIAARKFFGEFASINDVPSLPPGAWEDMLARKRKHARRLEFELMALEKT